ncbi:MAG: TIGR02996 domain-containing protein [Gemmataceae bacterium]
MNASDPLFTCVLENPADNTARLVLADCLRESSDPEAQALGRFLWGGVTAAGFRGDELLDDPLFYVAQTEIASVAARGFPASWIAALGLAPQPLTKRDWRWDNTFDRVSVRVGTSLGVFTRGLLAELSVTLSEWQTIATTALASWPIELVTVTDLPGLGFHIAAPDGEQPCWRLAAKLRFPRRRVPRTGAGIPVTIFDLSSMFIQQPEEFRVEASFSTRGGFVAGVESATTSLVEELRAIVQDRWPQPRLPR